LLIKNNIRRSINLDVFSCVGNHESEHKNITEKGMTRKKITNSKNTQDLHGKTLTVCQGKINEARYWYILLFKVYNEDYNN